MVTRQPAAQTRGMLSLAEAAELAGISIKTLRRRIAEGALPAFRTGPRRRSRSLTCTFTPRPVRIDSRRHH